MEELEIMLQNGTIDAATYQKLKQRLTSSQLQEEQRSNESAIRGVERYVAGERASGLGDVSVGGDVDENVFMDPEELETYTSRGIAPRAGVDYQNIRAERQSWQDQLANGVTKAVGKTVTGVAGGLAGLPTLAIVGLGQLSDAVFRQDNTEWKDIYDNDFQKAIDSANEAMDQALPNYVSNAQRENSALGSMLTTNFWANDFLGGMSFVASAILTEYLSAGMATPLALTRASKLLKAASTADKMAVANRYATKFKGLVAADRVLKMGRQIVTGAGYEAGVEARHFVDEAKDRYIQNYMQENGGAEPSPEELAAAMSKINGVGNSVFFTNLALVSTGHMVALPKTFGPGLAKKIGLNPGKVPDAKWVVKPSELTDKQLARMAKNTGKSIDELKAADYVNKFDSLTKAERLTRAAYGRGKGIVAEGFFEEGLQGVTNKAALDYVENLYNPDNIDETADVVESVKRGFEETYGLDQAEGWKEIIIGSLLGGMGGPNIGRAKGESAWQGGVFDYTSPGKSESVNKLIEDAIKYGVATPETVKYAVRENGIARKQNDALEQGDMYEAKTQEYGSMLSYVSMMTKLGRFDEIDSEISKMVEDMSPEEFSDQFGYTNLTEQELLERKTATLKTFKEKSLKHRKALELAERVNVTGDPRLTDALAFTFGISEDIDRREMELSKTFQEKVGKIYSTEDVKTFAEYVTFQRTTDAKELKEYSDTVRERNKKVAELEKATQEELAKNKYRTSTDIMERGKKLDDLEKEILVLDTVIQGIENRLSKQYTKYLKVNGILENKGETLDYSRDRQEFKYAYDMFKRVQQDISDTVGEDFHTTPEAEIILGDLNKLAAFRQQQITLANFYMTTEGQKKLGTQIDALAKMHEDELLSDELEGAVAQAKEEKAYDTKMQDIAIAAYINSAQKTYGMAFARKNIQQAEVELKEALNDVQDVKLKEVIADQCSKLNIALGLFRSDITEDAKKQYAEQGLQEIENIKKFFELFRNALTDEQSAEVDTFLQGEYLKQVAAEFNAFIKGFKKETNNTSTFDVPRIYGPNKLVAMMQDYIESDGKKVLMVNSADEIASKATLHVIDYPDGGAMANIQTAFNEDFDDQVKVQKGLVGDDVEKFGIQVKYNGIWIGNILDPNRYRFKDENDNYVDFNESVEHLELLNPEWVQLDTDGKKIPTNDGKFFIDHYRSTMLSFDKIKDEIRAGKREFSPDEVKSLFNIKQMFGRVDDVANDVPLLNWEHLQDGTIYTDLSLFDGTGKGILVQSKIANVFDYYLYNPNTKALEEIPLETKEKIAKYWESRQPYIDGFRGAYKIIYESDGAPKGIRLNAPEVTATENVIESINQNLTRLDKEVLDNIAKSKADSTNIAMVPGWDTTENFFLVSDAVGKTIYVKTTGTKENATNPTKGSTLMLGLNLGAGTDLTIDLISTDESKNKFNYTKKDGSPGVIDKRSFGWSYLRDTSGNLIITYKKKPIKDNLDLIRAINTYISDTLPDAIKAVNDAGGIDKVKNGAYKFVYNYAIKDSNGELKAPTISKINKNFAKEEFVDKVNEFTPAVNPRVTYLFQGKEQVLHSTDFQSLINAFASDFNKAKNSESLLNTLKKKFETAYSALSSSNKSYRKSNYEDIIDKIDKRIEEIKTGTQQPPQPPAQPPTPPAPPAGSNVNNSAVKNYGKKQPAAPTTNTVDDIEARRNALPDYQGNTRSPATQVILDYFAEVVGIPKWNKGLESGEYAKWLDSHDNGNTSSTETSTQLGYRLRYLLNTPKAAFDAITKYSEEIAAPTTNAVTVTPANQLIADLEKLEKQLEITKATIPVNRIGIDFLEKEIFAKKAEIAASTPPTTGPVKGNPFFARTDAQETTPIDIDEVSKRLAAILPPEIGVKAIEELVTGLANNAFTYGLFKNAVIYLGKDVPKGVEYHEAFHAVFRLLLTPAQQAKVLSEARNLYDRPTSEQLTALRELSDEYANLSLRELTNLYYEEQLADDFMDLMNGERKQRTPREKSFLEKMLDLLRKFVNLFKSGDPDKIASIDALFNSIKAGEFKGSKVVNAPVNNLSLFKALKFPGETENNNIVEKFHQTSVGANIISQVSALSRDRMRDVGFVYDTDIRDMIQQVVDNNISILIDVIGNEFNNTQYNSNPSLQESHQNELLNVIRSLYKDTENDGEFWSLPGAIQFEPTIEKNIRDIITNVRQHIDMIKFDEYDIESEDAEDNTTTDLAQKSNQRVGGLDSTTKEMKKYIMETEMPIDVYNLSVPKELLENDPRFRNYVNGVKLFNSIERMLVNTEREDLLKKFHYIKEGQPMLTAFYNRLIKDICLELGITYTTNIGSDIINPERFPIEKLAQSDKFNLFVAAFTKHKSESIVNRFDQESGLSHVFIANVNDSRKIQRESWYTKWKELNLDNKKKFVIDTLNDIDKIFKSFNSKDEAIRNENIEYLFNNFNSKVEEIKKKFSLVGISLSDKYVQLSLYKLLKENRDMSLVLSSTEEGPFKKLDKILESYNDVEFITASITEGLINSTTKDGSPFTNKSEIQKYNTDAIDIDESVEDALGAKGRLNDLASGNAMFDESVSASTIRNVEGEMVYIHLFPNYITSLFLKLRNNPGKLFNAVDADSFEKGVEIFKQFLVDNKLYVIDLLNDQQIEYFFRTLYFNPILKASNSELRQVQLENILPFTLDGLKQQSISATGQVESFKGSKSSAYAGLDKRGKFIMMLNLYAKTSISLVREVKVGDKTYEKYPLIAFQNEGKDTQWAFTMFKRDFIDNKNNLSDLGKEFLTNYLKGELSSIQAVYKDLLNGDGSIDGFNILTGVKIGKEEFTKAEVLAILKNPQDPNFMKVVDKYRGLNLTEFQFLKGLPIYSDIIKAAVTNKSDSLDFNAIVEVAFNNAYENFIKELSSGETSIIKKGKDNNYESVVLPDFYKDGNRNLDETKMKEFFINNWINAATVNNLIFGNLKVGLKDAVDLTKRYAGPNAAGTSLGFGDITFAVLNDELFDYVNPSTGKVKKGEERTNAQSYGTIEWYYNNYLKTFAKANPEVDKIYRKIRMMKEISAKERAILEDYGALMNPRKTSMFNAFVYGKTSTDVITRSEVSYVDEADIPAFEKAIDELLKIKDKLEYHKKQMEIQKFYKPIPSAVKRHELLNKMERQQVDISFFRSAIKTTKKNITNWDEELIPMKINSEFFREQVITDNMKKEVIHGTQLMQLIYSEHDDNYEVRVGGRLHTIGTLRKLYRKLLGDRLFESYGDMRKAIFDGSGNPNHKAMLKSFRQSIIEQGGDPTLLELFDGVGGQPNYNLNLPRLLSMYESMFLAFVGKGTFSQKVAGHKFTLAADFGEDVMVDDAGKVVTRREFLKNPKAYEGIKTRRLELKQGEDGVWYAECKISMQTAQMMNITEGEYLSNEFAEMLGIRIPTQDKHSMVKLKVVDILPAEKGNKLVMPYELLIMSGADFDIDSEFVRTVDYYTNTDAQGNEHINVYGSYLRNADPEKRLKYAFYDFYEEKINSKEVKSILADLKDSSAKLSDNKKAIERLTIAINDIKNDLSNQRKISRESEQALDSIIDDSTADLHTDILRNAKDLQDSHKKTLLSLIADKKALIIEKKKIVKELERQALASKGYPTTSDEFKNYRIRGQKTAGDIVEDNYTNYNDETKGSMSKLEPITIGELNNVLLDIEKALVNYGTKEAEEKKQGNNKRATTPASRDAAEAFIEKYYESEEFADPVNVSEYSTPTATVTMSHANAIGGKNIGIAAIGNIVFQYLKNANVEIENLGIKLDSYTNEDDQRINDLISTIISMAVDNAKFQDAIRFNITPQTQGAFIFMIMAKKPFDYVSLLHLQESVLKYSQDSAALQSPIQTKDEKSADADSSFESILESYKVKANTDLYDVEIGDITNELMVKAKKFSELVNNGTTVEDAATIIGMKEDLFNYVNYKALSEFLAYSTISRQSTGFSGFVSLIKGLSTELAETENILNKLESIGLQIVKKGNGQSFNDYVLEHTPEYIEYIQSIKESGEPNEKFPIDYKKVIEADPFLSNQVKAFGMFLNDSSKFFISRTPKAKKLFSKIQAITKPYYFNNVANLNRLIKLTNAYYADRALKHKYPDLQGDLSSIAVQTGAELPQLIKYLIDFKNGELYPQLASNKFIQMLDFKKEIYSDKSKGGFKNRDIYYVIANSFIRLSSEEQARVTADFELLMQPDLFTSDLGVANQITEFRRLLISQMLNKDLGMYRNQSYISFLPPSIFKVISNSLDDAMKALQGSDKDFKDVFGTTEEAFNKEFVEYFARHIDNTFNLKSQSSAIVFKQIKNTYRNYIKKMSDADTAYFEKMQSAIAQEILSYANQIKIKGNDKEAVDEAFAALFKEDSKIIELLPLKYERATDTTKAKVFVSIFPKSTEISQEELKALYKSPLTKLNKKALFATRLFGMEYVQTKNGVYSNMIYPEFIVFNFKKDNKSNYKVMKRVAINRNGIVSDNPDAGISAEYVESPRFASKNILPQGFPISQLEAAADGLLTEMPTDMTFGLTPDSFEDYSVKLDKDEIIKTFKELSAINQIDKNVLLKDKFTGKSEYGIKAYPFTNIRLLEFKDYFFRTNISDEINDFVKTLTVADFKSGLANTGNNKIVKLLEMIEEHFEDAGSSNNKKEIKPQQALTSNLTPSEYDAEFYKLNESYFKKMRLNSIEEFREMYGENPLTKETIDELVNSAKLISKTTLNLPTATASAASTSSTTATINYKTMKKPELMAVFTSVKSKLVGNPKYNIMTFYDLQAFVFKFDNDIIQKMINECI